MLRMAFLRYFYFSKQFNTKFSQEVDIDTTNFKPARNFIKEYAIGRMLQVLRGTKFPKASLDRKITRKGYYF